MITCKKDLINTYIENDHGELRDLYLSKCEDFGFLSNLGRKPTEMAGISAPYFGMTEIDGALSHSTNWSYADNGCKKLTLSDLKPRTKVEYEKVTLSLSEKSEILESGEWLYLDPDGRSHIDMNCAANWTIGSLRDMEVYRKVERPVEWLDDAVEYIRSLNGEANAIDFTDAESDGKKMAINISVVLDERQAKDFARILLEQEGE
mgnify:CR=1 FL=1|jgi:hypothetical protein